MFLTTFLTTTRRLGMSPPGWSKTGVRRVPEVNTIVNKKFHDMATTAVSMSFVPCRRCKES
jgi:hypothetical protein